MMFNAAGGSGSAGPNNSALTVVTYLYQNGFVSGDLGYAAAVGWMLALGVLTLAMIQMQATRVWKR